MKTIIIPTDFSATAANAVDYAIALGKEVNAGLLLLHVYQIPVTTTTDTSVVVIDAEDIRRAAAVQMHALKERIESKTNNSVKIDTDLRIGDTVTEIEECCNKLKPFAVVMGSNGHSAIEQVLFGSTTLKTIRHLTWPVIAVPADKNYSGIKKIGFACDYKHIADTTPVQVIKDFVKSFNAEFHVLNVDYENRHFKPETPTETSLVHTLLADLHPVYDFIEDRDIDKGIHQFAEKNKLDLLITIPKKYKLLDGLFRKSATKQLIAHAHVPVLCIHE